MEFPDVSSFLCPSPYRGCGGWQFRNRIHHLMRSFHPSDTNIAEGSIFRPPGRKIFLEIFSDLSSGLRPAPFWERSLRYILCCEANGAGEHGGRRFLDSASLRSKWQFDTCRSVITFIKAKSSLIRSCFFAPKKPGAFPSPMANKFGVCMVYGRARQGGSTDLFIVCFHS